MMQRSSSARFLAILGFFGLSLATRAYSQAWPTIGPYGGDARSFAYSAVNPAHILLGTTNSWIYQTDNGTQWTRLSKIAPSNSLVLDHIIFDSANPNRILVGAWRLDRPDGGIYISEDQGHHWQPVADMQGQSVRAFAQAPSDPKIFVAGTLKGVYRSQDGGMTWLPISPAGSTELHEVESIAIDPANPQDIYAGTWHLPWKTLDGGKTWQSIKQGLIDDSDVFSIIVDPRAPSTVYASACSGIYKSDDAGTQFHKIQGIPSAARRTRALKQDPNNPGTVYAGTTEGLYLTTDAGTTWSLMTPKDIIVNDVYVDPRNSQHVMMATDRSGVLDSQDGGNSFHDNNLGFAQRQVSQLVVDPNHPGTMYVGVLNDKRFGGVSVSKDTGTSWQQMSTGLGGHDVFALGISDRSDLLAGTDHGIYRWKDGKWDNIGNRLKATTRKVTHVQKKRRYVSTETIEVPDGKIEGSVRGLAFANGEWYAATADGMYTSDDNGLLWEGGPILSADAAAAEAANAETPKHAKPMTKLQEKHAAAMKAKMQAADTTRDFGNVAAADKEVLANGPENLFVSTDQGKTWQAAALPSGWSRVRSIAVDGADRLWIAGRLGVMYSDDQGKTWQATGIPINDISGLDYDPQMKRIFAASYGSYLVFGIDPSGKHWLWWNPGWHVHALASSNGQLVGATPLHGVVLQPENQPPAGRF
ncbi:MAG: WD40/YVTN/BNR-like repeat-containing protein [Acidobacteriaceae bacterium]